MNSIFICRSKKCRSLFAISDLDPQRHLIKGSMKCPNFDVCGGRLRPDSKTNIEWPEVKRLSALDLYQASLGVGVPQERKCSPAEVKKALVGAVITDIKTEPSSDPKRTIVYSLTLNSGKVVHLASSTKGATIFKMTEKSDVR